MPALRYGMVGGGPGAFIGDVHRMAAELDGGAALVAGAFSSDPSASRDKGAALGLAPDRVYGDYRAMAEAEVARSDPIDFVVVVTPNHLHFPVARTFLEAGVPVVCDKPMTTTVEDAETLCRLVAEGGPLFALTYNYTGYPMVDEARAIVRSGRLGRIRRIQLDYFQGWLATSLESTGHRQAGWRTDPERAGVAGALGDIGTHAHDLARYVTGLEVEEVAADLTTFVDGRRLEDDACVLVRWTGGARGTLTASQIAVGEENELVLRVYGTHGSIVWRLADAESLRVSTADGPAEILRRGAPYLDVETQGGSRLPPGHPEGFIEGFANVYRAVIEAIRGPDADGGETTRRFPTVWDGARGVHFLEKAVESARVGGWVDARYDPPGDPGA